MLINTSETIVEPKTDKKGSQHRALWLVGLFSFCFLAASLRVASKPVWMDEVLAVWVIRMHSARDIISALYHGSEFSPPTYHLLLHGLAMVAGSSYLVLRIPSILATLVSGLCVFALLRRYFDSHAAAFGMAFALLGFLSSFAVEIRPYALVVACFAFAALLWDRLDERAGDLWRIGLITLSLAVATALHFYAVLFVPCIAMMEALWSAYHRRLRLPVWLGLIAAGGLSLVWLPLIRALSHYNAGDSSSPNYYGRPIPGRLIETYSALFILDKKQALFLLTAVCLLAAAYALNKGRASTGTALELPQERQGAFGTNLYIVAFCAAAFPLLVFFFSVAVTKTYNARYCLIACLGFAVLLASVLSRVPAFRRITTPLLFVGCVLTLFRSAPAGVPPTTPEIAEVLTQATKPYPIVVAEGLQYFQLEEGLPDPLKSRLVYVTAPPKVKNPDPTNENQVKRWIPLRPDLKIVSADTFLAQNPHFYLLHSSDSTDVLTNWLIKRGMIEKLDVNTGGTWLFEAGSSKQPASFMK